MDLCAELTLHVMRFVQQPREPPASPRQWIFVPEGRRVNWSTARDLLAAAQKPLIVAPLAEPGMIGSWGIHTLRDEDLARAEHNIANQQQWLLAAVAQHGWVESDVVLLETEADQLELPLADLHRWLREYVTTVGWKVAEGPDPARRARLLIRRSAGDWSPGMVRDHHPFAA